MQAQERTRLPRLLTIREVEDSTGIPRWRLYEMLAKGEGPDHLRIGQTIRISETALLRWIAEREAAQREGDTR